MKLLLSFLICNVLVFNQLNSGLSFKDDQMQYRRVKGAYDEKYTIVKSLLEESNISIGQLHVFIRSFKEEGKLEVWGRDKDSTKYTLIKTYDICYQSGELGPKRQEGDLQVPEGFYHINHFNPYSVFHLSLGINYPNYSDRKLGVKNNLGGAIYIHGNCCSTGCIPITDEKIKELYILCVEAKNNGQLRIPVSSYPFKMTDGKYRSYTEEYEGDDEKLSLWEDLKESYDHFEEHQYPPKIRFISDGGHEILK